MNWNCFPPHGQPQWYAKQPKHNYTLLSWIVGIALCTVMWAVLGYYSYEAIPAQKHISQAVPAGSWTHKVGIAEYNAVVEKNP